MNTLKSGVLCSRALDDSYESFKDSQKFNFDLKIIAIYLQLNKTIKDHTSLSSKS